MTMMTTIAALQAVNRTVGVNAPDKYPASLNSADLPMALTLPADGTLDLEAIQARKRRDTTYRVFMYVAPVTEGSGVDEGTQRSIELLDALGDAYVTAANIQLTTSPSQAIIQTSRETRIRHSPIGIVTFAGVAYRGFTFDVNVMEKW